MRCEGRNYILPLSRKLYEVGERQDVFGVVAAKVERGPGVEVELRCPGRMHSWPPRFTSSWSLRPQLLHKHIYEQCKHCSPASEYSAIRTSIGVPRYGMALKAALVSRKLEQGEDAKLAAQNGFLLACRPLNTMGNTREELVSSLFNCLLTILHVPTSRE